MSETSIRLSCLELALDINSQKDSLGQLVDKFAAYTEDDPIKMGCLRAVVQTRGKSIARVPVDAEGGLLAQAREFYEIVKPPPPKPEPKLASRRGKGKPRT
jgi:hypothetical protein